jgi:hypothetical protein
MLLKYISYRTTSGGMITFVTTRIICSSVEHHSDIPAARIIGLFNGDIFVVAASNAAVAIHSLDSLFV